MAEGKQKRWLWPTVFGIAVAILAVVALSREPVELDPDTPEGTVQTYLQAIGDGDYETAFALLDPEFYEGCTAIDLGQQVARDEVFTATIDLDGISEVPDDRTVVPVRLQFGASGPFGDGWTSWESYVLIDRAGTWLITEDAWPYFSWACNEGDI